MLYEGEIIKIFPETDVTAYKNWIMSQGFDVIVRKDYIRVGRRTTYYKYDAKKLGELIFKKLRSCRNNHNCDMNCEKCQFNYSVSELNEAICAAVETLVERGKE